MEEIKFTKTKNKIRYKKLRSRKNSSISLENQNNQSQKNKKIKNYQNNNKFLNYKNSLNNLFDNKDIFYHKNSKISPKPKNPTKIKIKTAKTQNFQKYEKQEEKKILKKQNFQISEKFESQLKAEKKIKKRTSFEKKLKNLNFNSESEKIIENPQNPSNRKNLIFCKNPEISNFSDSGEFVIDFCEFVEKRNLEEISRVFQCEYCGIVFRKSTALGGHVTKNHRGKNKNSDFANFENFWDEKEF